MEDKYLILVNKENKMNNHFNYEIVDVDSRYSDNVKLEKKTYEAFLQLKDFVNSKGYEIEVESGYRDYNHQQRVWDNSLKIHGIQHTKKYVAKPGYSEHETGLAVDFILYENGKYFEDSKMNGHPVLELVKNNCSRYGFIIRYPKGKEDITGYNNEPWHLRFINDKKMAKYIMDNNICLEEYLEDRR